MDFSIKHLQQADKATALEAVEKDGLLIQHLSPELRNDADVVNKAFLQNQQALAYAGPQGIIGFLAKEKITFNNDRINHINPELWGKKEFVLEAVKINGLLMLIVDPSLKKDPEVVLAAIKTYPSGFEYADETLKENRDFIFSAIKANGQVISYLDPRLIRTREFALAAISTNPEAASPILMHNNNFYSDKEIMMKALPAVQPFVLSSSLSDSLRADPEFAYAMVQWSPDLLSIVSNRLQEDPEFILSLVKENPFILQYVKPCHQLDRKIVKTALDHAIGALQYADETLKGSRDFILNVAIPISAYAINYMSNTLKEDESLIRSALLKDPVAFAFVTDSVKAKLSEDKVLFMNLIAKDSNAINYASIELQEAFRYHEPTVREAIVINPWMLLLAGSNLQDKLLNDGAFMSSLIKKHPWATQLEQKIKEKRGKEQ